MMEKIRNGEKYEKEHESLCCKPETNTTLSINYTSIKKKHCPIVNHSFKLHLSSQTPALTPAQKHLSTSNIFTY